MSKGNTPLHDIQNLTLAELTDLYGIEVNKDGIVYDMVEGKDFPNLREWAIYTEEQNELYEDDTNSSYIYGKHPSIKDLDGW
jgi:hypothetical protein